MKKFQEFLLEQRGFSSLDSIIYGNTPIEFMELSEKQDDPIKNWFSSKGFLEKIKQDAPLNSSDTTQNDLQVLIKLTSEATSEQITFARYVDSVDNLAQSFLDLMSQHDISEDMGEFFRVDSQSESLLFYLKDVINRPRPYQLAKAYNIPLYPLIRTDAMTAAYPSGHALTGYVLSEYYARKYPQIANELIAHGEKIAKCREIVGIHFPSDTQISKEICRIICENNLIQ